MNHEPIPGSAESVSLPVDNCFSTVGETPDEFQNVLMREFSPYSVALVRIQEGKAKNFSPLGTGVLVQKGRCFGILTAHHCLHACSPQVRLGIEDGDTLMLILRDGRSICVPPLEAQEHVLAAPVIDGFGPDLTFIEVLSLERLGLIQAIGSFWPLDRPSTEVLTTFGSVLTPIVHVGFPEVDYKTQIERNSVYHSVRHMTYCNAIQQGDVFEREGWDYIDTTFTGADMPPKFTGVSGGPVWGYEERVKDGHHSMGKSALIGITFYQSDRIGDTRRLRAHFIKSIYERAWEGKD